MARKASPPERDFEHAAVNALEWLRLVGLASLGRDGQRAANLKLHEIVWLTCNDVLDGQTRTSLFWISGIIGIS